MLADALTIVWFRRDLRVADHPALSGAAARGRVLALFVVDPGLLSKRHHLGRGRQQFLRAGLEALDAELRSRGGHLTIRVGDPRLVLPEIARAHEADRVHITREVTDYGRTRDAEVAAALRATGVTFEEFGGDLVVAPEDLPGPAGNGYRVFTPFYRAWDQHPLPEHDPGPAHLPGPATTSDEAPLPSGIPLIEAGPEAARKRLASFVKSGGASAYGGQRNALPEDGTSRLSAYLRFGMCTNSQIGRALRVEGELPEEREAFWRQLAWREFFHHLAYRHPTVLRRALREDLRGIRWDNDDDALDLWCTGRTGYPIVDAAMRQLLQCGWMHNRARMIAGSFLVKDLLIDWRVGERHFMTHLLDGDPCCNNGGWQWVAGTGADAAPYFRVFNPTLQGKKFDPDGSYVRRFVPELASVPASHIHEPWTMNDAQQTQAACRIGSDYPQPMVNHAQRRAEVLIRYREARIAAGTLPAEADRDPTG